MGNIFTAHYKGETLTEFSNAHIGAILFLIISNLLIIIFLKRVRNKKYLNLFRYIAAALMLFYSVSFQVWSISTGFFTMEYSLPLHLCDIAIILSAIMLIMKNKFVFEVTYFWGLGGSLLAVFTPDIRESFPHFNFINYFLGHGGIITCVLFMTIIEKYRVSIRSIFRVYVITNLYMLLIAGINIVLKSNYLYICRKPDIPTLIDLLGPWPWYVLSLEGVSLLIFFVLYLPFSLNNSINSKTPKNLGV